MDFTITDYIRDKTYLDIVKKKTLNMAKEKQCVKTGSRHRKRKTEIIT